MPLIGEILDLLERGSALELDAPGVEPWWPQITESEEVVEVDYQRLFPRRRAVNDGLEDFELYGDDWELGVDDAVEVAEGVGTGGDPTPPEWDIWAWYQPIHFYGPKWGVFIKEWALREAARRIGTYLPPTATAGRSVLLRKALLRASFATLFLHEHYHHKIESAAIRMHVVEQRPIYPRYHHTVYRPARGTALQIEEGLANADSWRRVDNDPYSRWLGATVLDATSAYLEAAFKAAPPGYSNATRLLDPGAFEDEQCELLSQVQEGSAPTRSTSADFALATHLTHSLYRVNQRIWTIVPRGGRSVLPTNPGTAPLATRRLQRLVEAEGFSPVRGGGKGSHRKFRNDDGRMIIIPDAKEVSLPVLKSTAETLRMTVGKLENTARRA